MVNLLTHTYVTRPQWVETCLLLYPWVSYRIRKIAGCACAGWWFETLLRPFWRHCNVDAVISLDIWSVCRRVPMLWSVWVGILMASYESCSPGHNSLSCSITIEKLSYRDAHKWNATLQKYRISRGKNWSAHIFKHIICTIKTTI